MNVQDMTDQEKSVLLARTMEWEVSEPYEDDDYQTMQSITCAIPGRGIIVDVHAPFDLYRAPMDLAWKAHLWALLKFDDYGEWWRIYNPWFLEKAKRVWLDKVLELVLEVGRIMEKEQR